MFDSKKDVRLQHVPHRTKQNLFTSQEAELGTAEGQGVPAANVPAEEKVTWLLHIIYPKVFRCCTCIFLHLFKSMFYHIVFFDKSGSFVDR